MAAVNYEYVPSHTITSTGAKTVWIKCAGKTKERVTVMLLAASDGTKMDPFVVFKTKPSTVPETARENRVIRHGFGRRLWRDIECLQHGSRIYTNAAGWWNSELSIDFLAWHFGHRANMNEPVLLLWDDFSGHWRKDVIIYARLINVHLMKVPAGYTYVCQPADVAWNRPFKNHLRKEWIAFLLSQVRAAGVGVAFKMAAPERHEIVSWIKSAWSSLSQVTVTAGFRKAGLCRPVAPSSPAQEVLDEPSWGELIAILQQHHVATESIDPSKDIEAADVDEELVAVV
jgi:hypothetical protein